MIACRNETKALAAIATIQKEMGADNNTRLEFVKLDLNDLNSVKTFADKIKSKFEKVDILINNAGLFAEKSE